MRDERQIFTCISPAAPPRGLFSRIIKRLKLEKQLRLVKKHLAFFASFFVVLLTLSVFAFIGFKHVLAESDLGPFVSLMFSDPGMVLKYWQSFILSVFESAPAGMIFILLITVAFLLFLAKFLGISLERFSLLAKSVRKRYHTR